MSLMATDETHLPAMFPLSYKQDSASVSLPHTPTHH